MNYYNEFDPAAAQWLRNLIAAGKIPSGTVDDRDIRLVKPRDLKGFTQCHFFAGIGGWPLALQLAGWDESWPVWTGSCPCQPFSVAGNQKGEDDERHLWPAFAKLIGQCRPPDVFGEQVASRLGREWLGGVSADLEGMGYAFGGADLCAAGVSAPQIRQRLFWVARAPGGKQGHGKVQRGREHGFRQTDGGTGGRPGGQIGAEGVRLRGLGGAGPAGLPGAKPEVLQGARRGQKGRAAPQSGAAPGYWDAFDILECADGKARRLEPGVFPLAHGIPNRLVKLRAYGNAIVPQVAAKFIKAYLEASS
jgi:DNA (cytosine-5)-methyltransferase 1